ncbi:hypothetical protein TeGR_g13843 [Tetraparma gracilis]|uniref:N-acetyltransferase domain-containing protein n=1 Tax=Tetraparma gracilis TaxID=2962635 RepID=A0ABQ6N922_9STRA|nr:hypothetical protein TeGR_g13843 [Tetraparma gracilis]
MALRSGCSSVELCSAPAVGGLSPSCGSLSILSQALSSLPASSSRRIQASNSLGVLLRCRGGGFRHSPADLRAALAELSCMLAACPHIGRVAFGAAKACPDGTLAVDVPAMKTVARSLSGRALTFHRAFDAILASLPPPVSPGRLHALLDSVAATGATRLLTSGGCGTAVEGRAMLRRIQAYLARAHPALEVVAAAGLSAAQLPALLEVVVPSHVHLGEGLRAAAPAVTPDDPLGFGQDEPELDGRKIQALAEYEKEPDAVNTSVPVFLRDGYGDSPIFYCLALTSGGGGEVVGTAFFYIAYSTWEGRLLYLEDLYIAPEFRGRGAGKAIMLALAKIAREIDAGRFVWQAFDWNTPAIDFYKSIGASVVTEWVDCRMGREQIAAFVEGHVNGE